MQQFLDSRSLTGSGVLLGTGLAMALLSGCSVDYGLIGQPDNRAVLPPITRPAPLPPFEAEALPKPTVLAPVSAPAAAVDAGQLLLASARKQLADGDTGRAAATLERALRIAPNDPYLWHELAQVRLAGGQWQQAIALANKSRLLAAGNQTLRNKNSQLIATASAQL
ncbi:MAG: tetratricopeptide repeat protein [Immundisolibacteraceae bacterium]|nr:tetratricopeptide repeat protein [Immundisolibacteraceae bacterium]